MDRDLEYWKYKSQKYKSKYMKKLAELAAQQGGAAKAKASKKDAKKEGEKTVHKKGDADDRPSMRITCVKVHQKRENLHFEGSMCKTPPIRVRVSEDESKWAKVVKILLRYVSKRLRMNEVKKVEIKKGKKTVKLDGDKLGETFKLSEMNDIDEVVIFME